MVEIKAIIRVSQLEDVLHAMRDVPGAAGITVSMVEGFGRQQPPQSESGFGRVEMAKLETVVPRAISATIVSAIMRTAATGRTGDGKIFVLPVESVTDIRVSMPDRPTE